MPTAFTHYAHHAARWGAIGLGFSIPLTVSINNVFLALTVLAWLLGGDFRGKLAAFRHPGALAGIALFVLVSLGTLYGEADAHVSTLHLKKYADLMLIPVFLYVFRESAARCQGIAALAASLGLVLVLSYLLQFGLLPAIPSIQGDAHYPVVFKEHLTHNIFMAFGVFLFVWLARTSASGWARVGWGSLAVLAFVNVTVMVHGATGYLVLAGLLLLAGYRAIGWRGLAAAVFGMAIMVFTLMSTTNPFQQRVTKVVNEFLQWHPERPAATSTGWRLEFYQTTLKVVADHPLIGVGTGGFASAYAEKVKDTGKVATQNPHNEFLLMWAQLGIAGLAALIWMFARQWRLAARLPTRLESELGRGLVLTMVIGCMLNSLLLDHTEGLFFAWLTGVLYGGLKWPLPDNDARSATRTIAPTPVP